MRVPELRLYRGWREKAWAAWIIASQIRLFGLYMSPRVLAPVAVLWIGLQFSPLLIRPFGVPGMIGVTVATWVLLLSTVALATAARARPALRCDLIRRGIPVCLECGYDLIGTPDATRCPECGDDVTNLSGRAWEPLPETALYPELTRFPSAEAAKSAIAEAKRRAGVFVQFRRLTLIGVLIALTAVWMVAFEVADDLAYRFRRDLSPGARTALLSTAIASYPLVAVGCYSLVIARVRRELKRVPHDRAAARRVDSQ